MLKRVLHIHTLPVISGSGIHTLITMRGLKGRGYEVEFACAPGGALIDEVIKAGIPFHPIRFSARKINIFADGYALVELVWLTRRLKCTIIHTHNSKAGFLGRLAGVLTGVPVIAHTVHGFAFHDFEKPALRKLFIILERLASRFADKLIVVSTPLKEWGLRLKVGSKEKYVVIHDGIEIERFNIKIDPVQVKQKLGIQRGNLVVGTVAKLWQGKGHHIILEAAPAIIKATSNVRFIFVGDGYLRAELEKAVEEKGLKNYVIFTGFRADIPEITAIFDLAVLASFFEGLGRVLLEAMVLGKPVVASRVGGIPEVVIEGVNGFLVSPDDPQALARQIVKLLKDEDLRRRMGQAGKRMIDERFSAKRMVGDIVNVYEELLKTKGIYRKSAIG